MIATLARALSGRSPRERGLLALLVVLALPVAFVGMVVLPLIDAHAAARAELDTARAQRAWYQARQAEIALLPVPGAPQPVDHPAPVGLGGIETRLIDAGLRPSVRLLQNAQGGAVSIELQAVPFDALMAWLDLVGQGGYAVAALRLTRAGPALVDAALSLEPLP